MSSLIHEPLAIVGLSCRLPGADGLDAYWQLLLEGRSAIGELPPERLDRDLYVDAQQGVRGKTYSTLGGLICDRSLDPSQLPLDPSEFGDWDPCHLVMCEVAGAACQNAGYDVQDIPLKERTGVYIGHSGGSDRGTDFVYGTLADELSSYLRETAQVSALTADQQQRLIEDLAASIRGDRPRRKMGGGPALEANGAAVLIARTLGLGGPHLVTDAACASSLVAMMMAALALQHGQIEMAIVGGASFAKTDSLVLFSQARSCSATGSRPFDDEADGLVSSEGYAAIVIKTLSRARLDGDSIQAVISGLGVSSDGRGRSLWAPRMEGQLCAMQRAYGDHIAPSTVQYVEAHATSTQIGDATEMRAMAEFFTDYLAEGQQLPIGSVKSNIGHTLETAGVASLLKTVLAMQHRVIPPTINLKRLNSTIDWDRVPFFVPTEPLAWPTPAVGEPRRAAVSSFGIGGLNVHLVVEEHQAEVAVGASAARTPSDPAESAQIVRDQPIAIVGRGAILPGALSVDDFFELMDGPDSAITVAPADRWRARDCVACEGNKPWHTATLRGGFITDYSFDWRRHRIPPKQIAQANPLQFMLLDAAYQALGEAGYDSRPFDRQRTAVVVGTIFGGEFGHDLVLGLRLPDTRRRLAWLLAERGFSAVTINEIWHEFEAAFLTGKPALIDETGSFTSSTLASRISKELNLMGGAMAVDAGECSSFAALDVASNLLRSASCRQVLCAAAQRSMDLANYEALTMQNRLAHDAATNGMVPGEGVVVLLLKRLVDAQADGDQVLGVLQATESANDHRHPDRAIETCAARLAKRSPGTNVAIAATDGQVPDLKHAERQALLRAYGERLSQHQSNLVSKTGHLLATHGLANLLYYLNENHASASTRIHLSNSGPNGLTHQLLLDRTRQPSPTTRSVGSPQAANKQPRVIRIGAESPETLNLALVNAAQDAARHFAKSATGFQPDHRYRVAICAQTEAQFAKAVTLAAKSWQSFDARAMLAGQGVVYGTHNDSKPQIAFMFPGQGSQYPEMMGALAKYSVAACAVMEEANSVLEHLGSRPFAELVQGNVERLRRDLWSNQITILIADLMAFAAVRDAGIEPDRVCGHSFGEFACLVAAGTCSLEQVIHITRARTEAVQGLSERGALLSLAAPEPTIRALIDGGDRHVSITHFNAPEQTVIGGSTEEVDRFNQLALGEGIHTQLLKVPCAFHTPLMEPAKTHFLASIEKVVLEPARVPWLMNVGTQYCAEPADLRSKLAQQLVEPVHYVQLVNRLADEGVRLFVEVGPQQVLTRLNQRILSRRDVSCLSVDAVRNEPAHNVALLLAQLECFGDDAQRSAIRSVTPRSRPSVVHLHDVEYFDATQARRQRRRQSPSPRATADKTPSIARFDATANRRGQAAEKAGHTIDARPLAEVANGEPIAAQALEQFLIDFVVEHTGYPAEILDLDWDLEADLGIDSIKRAQLFGELRELFDIESTLQIATVDAEQQAAFSLDDFRTLRQVLDLLQRAGGKREWLEDSARRSGNLGNEPATALEPDAGSAGSQGHLEQFLIDFVVEHTGYPPEVVELEADFEADLGIDSIKKAQLFGELREHFSIEVTGNDRFSLDDFRTLQSVVDLLRQIAPATPGVDLPTRLPDESAPADTESVAVNGKDGRTAQPSTTRFDLPPSQTTTMSWEVDQSSAAYQDGLEWGRNHEQEIWVTLQKAVDGAEADPTSGGHRALQTELTYEMRDEIQGVADGARLHVGCVAAHYALIRPATVGANVENRTQEETPSNGEPNHGEPSNREPSNGEPSNGEIRQDFAASFDALQQPHDVTQRYQLRMADAPQPLGSPARPPLAGAALVVGDGPVCDAIRERFAEEGHASHVVDPRMDPGSIADELERVWETEHVPHLFLVLPEIASDANQNTWAQNRDACLMAPFWLCQRWMSLMAAAGLLNQGSLIAVTSLGGDFGLSGSNTRPDTALTGLVKAIVIESWMNGHRCLRAKVIDSGPHQSVTSIVDGVFRELAVPSYDAEISWLHGRRQVVRAVRAPLTADDQRFAIDAGTNWVCAGGARGVTAFVAKELAIRHQLTLHLLGTSPQPQIPENWRNAAGDHLKQLKLDVMTTARKRGANPVTEWRNAEKAMEIDRTLCELQELGVEARYYQCDISCRQSLGQVLDQIRRRSGSIDAVLQGAGVGRDGRFEKKDPRKVDECLRAKIDGTLALMDLTHDDPLQFFIAFGSISGRFGANGHTDYSLANDMLAKLVGWYRVQRPEVKSVAFHWHAWGDVGMATKPETKLALEMIDMQFMPAEEGLQHLVRELQAGAPSAEVLITDDRYCRLFYPTEAEAQERGPRYPLLDRGNTHPNGKGEISTFPLCPVSDPFLVEHRLDDKPLLPVVVGLELLCEAAARLSGLPSHGLCLTQVQAANGLRFHTDRAHDVSVRAEEIGHHKVHCEVTSDFVARNGRLVEKDRLYLSGVVEPLSQPLPHTQPTPPATSWHRVEYPTRGSKFYSGPPLRCLQEFTCDERVGWGRVAAPAPIELTGPRHSVTDWIVPSAALDACLYAVGLLAWFAIEPGVALPESIAELKLGRFPARGEACLVETHFRRRESQFGWFDFTLFGVNGEVLIDATDYRIVWLPSGELTT